MIWDVMTDQQAVSFVAERFDVLRNSNPKGEQCCQIASELVAEAIARKSLDNVMASIVEYNSGGDRVVITVSSKSLNKLGWKGSNGNMSSAYLTGLLAGKKAIEKGISEAILDLGFNTPTKGSKLYAVVSGAMDSGLKIPFNLDSLPNEKRISGEHIANYAQLLKKDDIRYQKQFSAYIKRGLNPEDIVKHFNDIKGKIHGKEKD